MIELFIEGHRADISQEFSTLMTYCIDDIKDFSARNTSFSKTIIMPGTNKNNKLFGNIFEINNGNFYDASQPNVFYNYNASVSARAIIFNDNIQLFKGVLKILQIVIDKGVIEYEVSVVGELGGLVLALGNKKLEDLDFSAYDHDYTLLNIQDSWVDENRGYGWYYPLIDYGTYGRNAAHNAVGKHSWKYKTFRPALYVREYLTKIFNNANYTIDAPIFDTDRFKRLIIPNSQKELTNNNNIALDYTTGVHSTTFTNHSPGPLTGHIPIAWDNQIVSGNFTYDSSTKIFTYIGASSISININLKLNITYAHNNLRTLRLSLRNITTSTDVLYQDFGYGAYNGSIIIDIQNISATFNTGDTFNISVSQITAPTESFSITVNATDNELKFISTSNTVLTPINLNERIIINNTLPSNFFQKDFLSWVIKLFNLYIYEDNFSDRHIKIAPFADDGSSTGFYNGENKIDWTYKVDRNSPITIKPMSELNARYYEFLYKKDSDYWNDLYNKRYNITYGSYLYDSGFQFSKETEKIEIGFSGTPIVGYVGEDKIYSTILKRTGTDTIVEETTDSNIRILQAKRVYPISSWDILGDNGTTVLGSYTTYPYAGHFNDPDAPANDLNFGVPKELFFTLVSGAINVNQFNVYWSSYMAEITDKDSKLLTCTMRLKTSDIFNLDFSKFIYIDGSLFRLVKIEDYNTSKEDTCKVTLLKVINTQY